MAISGWGGFSGYTCLQSIQANAPLAVRRLRHMLSYLGRCKPSPNVARLWRKLTMRCLPHGKLHLECDDLSLTQMREEGAERYAACGIVAAHLKVPRLSQASRNDTRTHGKPVSQVLVG